MVKRSLDETTLKHIKERALLDKLPQIPSGGIKFRDLALGMSFVAVITDITMADLRVALPNGLLAFISMTDISETYKNNLEHLLNDHEPSSDQEDNPDEQEQNANNNIVQLWKTWFQIGQVIPVSIKSLIKHQKKQDSKTNLKYLDSHNRIECSIMPTILNQHIDSLWKGMLLAVSVHSIEEKGVLVTINSSKKAFYPCSQDVLSKLRVGQWLLLQVSKPDSKLPQCSLPDPSKIKPCPDLNTLPTIADSVRPLDILQNLKVIKNIQGKGLIVELGFEKQQFAIIDILSLPRGMSLNDYKEGDVIPTAQVIYAYFPEHSQNNSILALSFFSVSLQNTKLISLKSGQAEFQIGDFVESLVVERVDPKSGLFVSFTKNGNLDELAKKKSKNNTQSKNDSTQIISKSFGFVSCSSVLIIAGSVLPRARITGYRPLEDLYTLSDEPSILEAPFLTYEGITPGMKVQGTLHKWTEHGAVISLTEHLKGFLPAAHMIDQPVTDLPPTLWKSKLKEGTKYSLRVWAVFPASKKVILTKKATLVQSPYPPFPSAPKSETLPETTYNGPYHGMVVQIKPKIGAMVQFYGDMRKFLPISEIQEKTFIKTIEHVLPLYSIVTVWPLDSERVTMIPPKTSEVESNSGSASKPQRDIHKSTPALSVEKEIPNTKENKNEDTMIKAEKKKDSKRRKATDDTSMPSGVPSLDQLIDTVDPLPLIDTDTTGAAVVESSTELEVNSTLKKTKRNKREEELEISKIENELINKTSLTCREDYEKAILADAANPWLWIQYIYFLVQRISPNQALPTPTVNHDFLKNIRHVIGRSFSSIPYAQPQDHLKVWTVYLTLEWQLFSGQLLINENLITPHELQSIKSGQAFDACVSESLLRCEPLKLYTILWDIYWNDFTKYCHQLKTEPTVSASSRVLIELTLQRLLDLQTKILKKTSPIKHDLALWERLYLLYWHLYLNNIQANGSNIDESKLKELTDKATTVYLSKEARPLFLAKVAHLEFLEGFPSDSESCVMNAKVVQDPVNWTWIERARTRYEQIIADFPKRFDLWLQYLSKEMKLCSYLKNMPKNDIKGINFSSSDNNSVLNATVIHTRHIFERAVMMGDHICPGGFFKRQMKTLLKFYLDFEEAFGSTSTVNHVKVLATQYVSQKN